MIAPPLRSLPIDTAIPGLAARLRLGTQALHHQAETSPVMAALLRGELSLPGYRALLVNLQALYAALEQAVQRHADIAPLPWPRLFRGPALAADLQALGGADKHPPVPATAQYVQRLHTLGGSAPGSAPARLLLAHAYVRYLGDLHGGQLIRRRVAPMLASAAGLVGDEGTRFHHFGDAAEVAQLIHDFRQALDTRPLDEAATAALVAEAQEAFRLHIALFAQLPARGA